MKEKVAEEGVGGLDGFHAQLLSTQFSKVLRLNLSSVTTFDSAAYECTGAPFSAEFGWIDVKWKAPC